MDSIVFQNNIAASLPFGFMPYALRALIVGLLVALCAALLGVSLVLKRFSMIGDGLSHVGFGALAVAMAFHWAPLAVSIPVVMLAAFVLLCLGENSLIKGDAAIAILSGTSLAFGVMVASKANLPNVTGYLFGSLLAIEKSDAVLSVILTLLVLAVYAVSYHRIFAITFDEEFTKATGMPLFLYKGMIGLMTAVIIVLGMRIMGALLISSLIIFPSLTAMRVWGSFRSVAIASAVLAVVNFFIGFVMCFVWNLQPGPTIVLVHAAVFSLFWLLSKCIRLFRRQ
jgi:zinc transport system permease protein